MANIKTVLIIDDNEDIRTLLKRVFTSAGINSTAFANSKEAIDYLKGPSSIADLIILDLGMPEINGFQFLEMTAAIRKQKPFKVCVLSGAREKDLITKALSLKADDYIVKPVDKLILLNKVRGLLGIQSIELTKFAFARVGFQATLINLPVLLNFTITGVSEEGLLIESPCNFREQAIINFKSRSFSDSIDYEQDYSIKIVRTQYDKNKFQISSVFVGLPAEASQKIRAFTTHQNVQISASMFS